MLLPVSENMESEKAALLKQMSEEFRSHEESLAAMPRTDDNARVRAFISDHITSQKRHYCCEAYWSSRGSVPCGAHQMPPATINSMDGHAGCNRAIHISGGRRLPCADRTERVGREMSQTKTHDSTSAMDAEVTSGIAQTLNEALHKFSSEIGVQNVASGSVNQVLTLTQTLMAQARSLEQVFRKPHQITTVNASEPDTKKTQMSFKQTCSRGVQAEHSETNNDSSQQQDL